MKNFSMREFYNEIITLYEKSETDEAFVQAYVLMEKKYENITLSEPQKMKINNIDDLKIILKVKYCMELQYLGVWTAFNNAHYIAGDISKEILLGRFKYRSLTPKQRAMFEKSMFVDFSNLDNFDLRKMNVEGFIKDKNISFF